MNLIYRGDYMNSAIFIHSQKNLSFLKEYTKLGFVLITTEESLGCFSFSPTVYVRPETLYIYDSKASEMVSSYEKVITSSISDWIDLRFLFPNITHLLQYKNQLDEKGLLTNTINQLQTSLSKKYSVDVHKLLIKALYLAKRFQEARQYTYQLLRRYGHGDFCLSLLMLISTQEKDFHQSLQLLNALATKNPYKQTLEKLLVEPDLSVLQREFFIAGKDFASIEEVHHD